MTDHRGAPSEVAIELRKLYNEHDKLTPEIVLEAAKNPQSALHSHFEWDDAEAAQRHRLDQARGLIRTVKITYEHPDPKNAQRQRIRAYVSLPATDGETAYRRLEDVVEDRTSMEILLRQMRRDWRALETRYRCFAEFWELVQEATANREETD